MTLDTHLTRYVIKLCKLGRVDTIEGQSSVQISTALCRRFEHTPLAVFYNGVPKVLVSTKNRADVLGKKRICMAWNAWKDLLTEPCKTSLQCNGAFGLYASGEVWCTHYMWRTQFDWRTHRVVHNSIIRQYLIHSFQVVPLISYLHQLVGAVNLLSAPTCWCG